MCPEKRRRKVRARLVVREIIKAKLECWKQGLSDVFCAIWLVSHVITEQVDWRGRFLVFCVSRAHFCVCEHDVHVEPLAELLRPRFVEKLNKPIYGMRVVRGRICGVKISATMALRWVQVFLHCADQNLWMESSLLWPTPSDFGRKPQFLGTSSFWLSRGGKSRLPSKAAQWWCLSPTEPRGGTADHRCWLQERTSPPQPTT